MYFLSMNFPEKSLHEAFMDLLSVSNSHCEIFIENSHQHHEHQHPVTKHITGAIYLP